MQERYPLTSEPTCGVTDVAAWRNCRAAPRRWRAGGRRGRQRVLRCVGEGVLGLPARLARTLLTRGATANFAQPALPPSIALVSFCRYVISKMRAEPASCTRGLSWDAFAREPMAPGARCRTEPECCTQSAGFFWHHVSRQSRCLLAGDYTFSSLDGSGGMDGPSEQGGAGGGGSGDGGSVASGVDGGVAAAGAAAAGSGPRWALDYIGRMEHMAEDLEEILQEIDRRRDPSMPALAGGMQVRPALGMTACPRYVGVGGWRGQQSAAFV